MKLYPMKLTAPCKDYIWGGTRLREEYGKTSDADRIAESWELSCHKDGESIIFNGDFAGKTLSEFIKENGKDVLGKNCDKFDNFPILIKLIDAKENLSVQVHPDNEYALSVEGEYGKTEMWYIVDCDPGAELLYGFKSNIDKEEFERRIKDNTLLEVTNSVPVHKGDVFFIEAGTLHAIGKGILIAEIQQNSNTTYRIYDYGRVGADGKPRQLHVEKAVEVTKLTPPEYPTKAMGEIEQKDGCSVQLLSKCDYFRVNKVCVWEHCVFEASAKSFNSVLVLDGEGEIDGVKLKKGDSCFIPAGYGEYTFKGKAEMVITDID
jgi:mannose-6-phosphate isomerase